LLRFGNSEVEMTEVVNHALTLNQLIQEKSTCEIIAITSGKGGVGKTFLSINFAIYLAQLKKKILLLDADIHLGNVDLFLGLRPRYTVKDVIVGEKEIEDIIIKGPENIDIIPASDAVKDLITREKDTLRKFNQAYRRFNPDYDAIIIDTGAGISRTVLAFLLGADKIIVVVTPDPASITDAYSIMKIVTQFNPDVPLTLVTNMVRNEEEGQSLFNKMNLMTERFLQRSIYHGGSILESPIVAESVKKQIAMMLHQPNTAPMHVVRNLVRKMFRIPMPEVKRKGGLFDRIINLSDLNLGEEDE